MVIGYSIILLNQVSIQNMNIQSGKQSINKMYGKGWFEIISKMNLNQKKKVKIIKGNHPIYSNASFEEYINQEKKVLKFFLKKNNKTEKKLIFKSTNDNDCPSRRELNFEFWNLKFEFWNYKKRKKKNHYS